MMASSKTSWKTGSSTHPHWELTVLQPISKIKTVKLYTKHFLWSFYMRHIYSIWSAKHFSYFTGYSNMLTVFELWALCSVLDKLYVCHSFIWLLGLIRANCQHLIYEHELLHLITHMYIELIKIGLIVLSTIQIKQSILNLYFRKYILSIKCEIL